jgi:predicted nucleic acid-binding protein
VSGFLLDTNIISELVRPKPEPRVTAWVASTDENLLFLSVLTLGEIRKGVVSLKDAARRVALEAWLDGDLVVRFSGRILEVGLQVADRWGRLSAQVGPKSELPVIDGLLAATAMHYNLTLVTRNTKDVAGTGVPLFNPWAR